MLLLLAAEGILRWSGFGFPTSFFLRAEPVGTPILIENRQFGWRFFPPAIARAPEPMVLPAVKPPGTVRLFVLGESAALGDPEPAFGFSRLLRELLADRFPDRTIEVVNVAMTAINSHAIREIARDCAGLEGDFWVVYMGHNEVVGPFGAGTVFGPQTPGLLAVRANLALRRTRVGQFLDALRARLSPSLPAAESWGGMEMFLSHQVRQDAPSLQRVYHNYERNLRSILSIGAASGAHVLACTVPSNLKDCAPFASRARQDMDEPALAAWQTAWTAGQQAETARELARAVAHYRQAEATDATFAELQFRLGRCLLALGQNAEAATAFSLARDHDVLRFRADSRINHLTRKTVAELGSERVVLVDAEVELARLSPQGIPGDEWFYEHVHLNLQGNLRLARLLATAVAERIAPPPGVAARPWLSDEALSRRVAWTPWSEAQVSEEVGKRLQEPPFSHQLGHELRNRYWQQRVETLLASLTPETFQTHAASFRQAIEQSPNDWFLRDRFARMLEEAGDYPAAAGQWLEVVRLLPHDPRPRYQLGNLLETQGNLNEARRHFEEALRLQPDFVEAWNGLGLVLAAQGMTDRAVDCFERALTLRPRFAQAHVNWGLVLAGHHQLTEAQSHYETALNLQTNNVAAHLNLGRLLASQGRTADALHHYKEAVRWRPTDAIAHFNLANLLAETSQPTQALEHYARAVALQPRFAEARHNYGLELLNLGRGSEGIAQLREAVRLKPDYPAAHLNLGVALAKAQQWTEAAACFRETLRFDPANQSARQYLQTVENRLPPTRPR